MIDTNNAWKLSVEELGKALDEKFQSSFLRLPDEEEYEKLAREQLKRGGV